MLGAPYSCLRSIKGQRKQAYEFPCCCAALVAEGVDGRGR